MAFNLQQVLKALLFSSSQPLSIKDIQGAFARFHEQAALPLAPDKTEAPAADAAETSLAAAEPSAELETPAVEAPAESELYQDVPSLITASQIREAMDVLAADLRAADDVFLLTESAQGYRLVTHPRYARWIRILRNEPPAVKLSQSALETLAIVAYRQPVTRSEIEAIRGVSAEAGVNKLLERELIYITGRADLPGRPLQFGTTDKFLEFVGVKSLVELPASDVLSPRQIDEWLKNAMNPTKPGDEAMGLPQEDLPLETATVTDHGVVVQDLPEPAPVAEEPAAENNPPSA
ncbi:hypothetical protein MASR2M8_12730 [Opitutaceae bacterium]